MNTLAKAQTLATSKGISIDSYNPGDKLTYKIDEGVNKSFFEMSLNPLYRCKTLSVAYKFIIEYNEDQVPEDKREFVSQYAEKFIECYKDIRPLRINNTKYISDIQFDKAFENCALPLRQVFYPMCREEIKRILGGN
jgi:hypothetical protein